MIIITTRTHHDHGSHRPHVAVVARPAAAGVIPSLVFPELTEGRYELYRRPAGPVELIGDDSRRAGDRGGNAAIGNAWEKALMHTDSASDAHEVWHRRTAECCAGRARVFLYVHVFDDDISGGIDVVPIEV